jgi:glutathione synthase/RimK-type ligase-like ATP-grasp enzyme
MTHPPLLKQTYGRRILEPSAHRIGAIYTAFDSYASMGVITREKDIRHRGPTLDINSQISAEFAMRKSATSSLLKLNNISVPREIVIPDPVWCSPAPTLEDIKNFSQGDIVVKPENGTRGRGVSLHKTSETAMLAIHQLSGQAILVQDRIYGPELRVVLVHNKIIGGYWRRKTQDGFGNLSTGEHPVFFKNDDIPKAVADISYKATQILGLAYTGLDIIISENGPVILEANASPMMVAAMNVPGGLEWSNWMMDAILTRILTYTPKPNKKELT